MSNDEYLAMVTQALKSVKPPDEIDIADIQRHIEEEYTLIEDMQLWLDKFLKN